jgi:hypothetical protein
MISGVTLIEPRAPRRERSLQPSLLRPVFETSSGSTKVSVAQLRIAAVDWLADDVDLLQIDGQVHRFEDARLPFCLVLEGDQDQAELVATQILTRYQRLLPLGEEFNQRSVLDVLPAHRALFDTSKPLVRADYDHALDTWRWVLRLSPTASIQLQLAALFHDIERLSTEADVRVEHLAPDYLEFKRLHAAAGALYLTRFLTRIGFASDIVERVGDLVRSHEEPGSGTELALLNDADSLSFFSLNSWGFFTYFGEEHTRMKVRFTLGRMSRNARAWLPTLRQHPRVAEYICQYGEDWS